MKINGRDINKKGVFIIAEMSANHNQSFDVACETIHAIARSGADAVKLQTYTAETITLDLNTPDFRTNDAGPWAGQSLFELYKKAYTPWEWHHELFKIANEVGLVCFSSPFDASAVDFLESLNNPCYKIASFEITDIPLIEYAASKGKPLIISTGVAAHEDIELALDACYRMGNREVALLKCTSSYPSTIEEANMAMIRDMASRYTVTVGLSDHSMGSIVPVVATCFGAKIIEKHFILDRSVGGPDASFSLTESEFSDMVKAVRDAEKAIGIVDYNLTPKQLKSRDSCRSLYVSNDIAKGEIINERNIASVRPGFGLHPKYYHKIMCRKALKNLFRGDRLRLEDIEDSSAD